jgi:hypothetical protein
LQSINKVIKTVNEHLTKLPQLCNPMDKVVGNQKQQAKSKMIIHTDKWAKLREREYILKPTIAMLIYILKPNV